MILRWDGSTGVEITECWTVSYNGTHLSLDSRRWISDHHARNEVFLPLNVGKRSGLASSITMTVGFVEDDVAVSEVVVIGGAVEGTFTGGGADPRCEGESDGDCVVYALRLDREECRAEILDAMPLK